MWYCAHVSRSCIHGLQTICLVVHLFQLPSSSWSLLMLYISFLVPNLVLLIEFALVPLFLNFYFRNYLFTNRVQHGLFGHIQRTYPTDFFWHAYCVLGADHKAFSCPVSKISFFIQQPLSNLERESISVWWAYRLIIQLIDFPTAEYRCWLKFHRIFLLPILIPVLKMILWNWTFRIFVLLYCTEFDIEPLVHYKYSLGVRWYHNVNRKQPLLEDPAYLYLLVKQRYILVELSSTSAV